MRRHRRRRAQVEVRRSGSGSYVGPQVIIYLEPNLYVYFTVLCVHADGVLQHTLTGHAEHTLMRSFLLTLLEFSCPTVLDGLK